MATPTEGAMSGFKHLLDKMIVEGKVDRVDFSELEKTKDHWHKEFKIKNKNK